MNDAKCNDSIFDFDPTFCTHSSGGDIVYKILGIEPHETMSRAPNIIINRKMRQDKQDVDVDEEEPNALGPLDELENLKNLFKQEDLRDDTSPHTSTIRHQMKRVASSSKSCINKKVNSVKLLHSSSVEPNKAAILHESQSDISLYKPVSAFRDSATELGTNLMKKVKNSHTKHTRDGVGMATLLVRSMMTAPSLDSIAENVDHITDPKLHEPISKLDVTNSSSIGSLPMKKHHHQPHHIENKLNISVGDSIIDLKASESGNLSSGVSMSSATISETSSEDDNCSELGDEVVMIDADTISM